MIQRATDTRGMPLGFLACTAYFLVWLCAFIAWMFAAASILQTNWLVSLCFWSPSVIQGMILSIVHARRGLKLRKILNDRIVLVHVSTSQMTVTFWTLDEQEMKFKLSSAHYVGNSTLTLDANSQKHPFGVAKISVPAEKHGDVSVRARDVLAWFKHQSKNVGRLKRSAWKKQSNKFLGFVKYENARCLPKLLVD